MNSFTLNINIIIKPAVFGEDQEISCMIRLNLSGLQSMCNYASLSNYDIFNNFNTEQNIYIGRYGNANPLYINVINSNKISIYNW